MYTLSPSQQLNRYLDLAADADEELARQRAIVRARNFHSGHHFVRLTTRLRQFLGDAPGAADSEYLRFNITRIVTQAVLERLAIQAITTPTDALREYYDALLERSGGAILIADLLEMALVDGEAFLIADWDSTTQTTRLYAHPRYVDAAAELEGTRLDVSTSLRDNSIYTDRLDAVGIGYGCIAHYVNDDPSMPLDYVVKRWRETYKDERTNSERTRQRMTKYYPDRVEKWALDRSARWEPITDDPNEPWPLPMMLDGEPLGILAVHVTNVGMLCEAWEAIPLQNAINKSMVDLMQSLDLTAFRVYFGAGFTATSNGQSQSGNDSDGDPNSTNALIINPGEIISSTNPDATLTAIDGADPARMLNTIESLVRFAAIATDTPTARLIMSGQVARAETIKEQETPLVNKVKRRQEVFGVGIAHALHIGARLQAFYAPVGLPTDEMPYIEWVPAETQDEREKLEVAGLKREKLGLPLAQVWREYGYTEEEIERMLVDKQRDMPMITTATPTGQMADQEETDNE